MNFVFGDGLRCFCFTWNWYSLIMKYLTDVADISCFFSEFVDVMGPVELTYAMHEIFMY